MIIIISYNQSSILLRIWKICIDGPQKQKQLMDAWSQCGAEGSYRRREWKETEGDRNILIVKNVYKSWGCIMIECFWWSESTCLSPIRIHPRSTNREEYTIHLKSGWKNREQRCPVPTTSIRDDWVVRRLTPSSLFDALAAKRGRRSTSEGTQSRTSSWATWSWSWIAWSARRTISPSFC